VNVSKIPTLKVDMMWVTSPLNRLIPELNLDILGDIYGQNY
jgi:hypothetical protein